MNPEVLGGSPWLCPGAVTIGGVSADSEAGVRQLLEDLGFASSEAATPLSCNDGPRREKLSAAAIGTLREQTLGHVRMVVDLANDRRVEPVPGKDDARAWPRSGSGIISTDLLSGAHRQTLEKKAARHEVYPGRAGQGITESASFSLRRSCAACGDGR
jgi:hypothetical protein